MSIRTQQGSAWGRWVDTFGMSGLYSDDLMEVLGEVAARAADHEDIDDWLDELRGMSFEAMLVRFAEPAELAEMREHPTLRALLDEAAPLSTDGMS